MAKDLPPCLCCLPVLFFGVAAPSLLPLQAAYPCSRSVIVLAQAVLLHVVAF